MLEILLVGDCPAFRCCRHDLSHVGSAARWASSSPSLLRQRWSGPGYVGFQELVDRELESLSLSGINFPSMYLKSWTGNASASQVCPALHRALSHSSCPGAGCSTDLSSYEVNLFGWGTKSMWPVCSATLCCKILAVTHFSFLPPQPH